MKPTPVTFADFFSAIWSKIPSVWRTADTDSGKGLYLLTYTMAQQLYYYFYLKIVYMDELFDPDKCPDKHLKFLASMIGWELVGERPESWREQIRSAPLLYKMKGSEKSIIIAEKLVGYSIFMAQLYRDTTGELVTKDRIFNNIPDTVRRKPWFRRLTPLDVRADLFSLTLSTSFPSYNRGTAVINSETGEVQYRKPVKQVGKYVKTLSTTPYYNNITGANSLARYARTTRYNIVLKKDVALDYIDANGNTTRPELDAALYLFLQFKPFHVHVENMSVMYDLSDYVFGTSSDTIPNREYIDIKTGVSEAEQVLFNSGIRSKECLTTDLDTEYTNIYSNKGTIEAKYLVLPLDITNATFLTGTESDIKPERISDANYLANLGFSLRQYKRNTQLDEGRTLWYHNPTNFTDSDFEYIPDYRYYDDDANNYSGTKTYGKTAPKYDTKLALYDKKTHSVKAEDFLSQNDITAEGISFGFYFYSFGATLTNVGFASLKSMLRTKYPDYDITINSTNVDLTALYNDSITYTLYSKTTGNPVEVITERIDRSTQGVSNAWSLRELHSFSKEAITSLAYKNIILSDSDIAKLPSSSITKFNSQIGENETVVDSTIRYEAALQKLPRPLSPPIADSDVQAFNDVTSGEIHRLYFTNSGILLNELYNSDYIFILEYFGSGIGFQNSVHLLVPNIDYRFLFNKNGIILNSREIANKINLRQKQSISNLLPGIQDDTFLKYCRLHCLFLVKTNTKYTYTLINEHTRSSQIPIRRHKKFNRLFWVKNLDSKAHRDNATYSPELKLNSVGELEEDLVRTRLFKQDLPLLLTRSSLQSMNQQVTGIGAVPAITRYSRNIRDTEQWKVYSDPNVMYYIGPEKVSTHFWSNYFNTTLSTANPPLISYNSVDTSYETQLINRNSVRWRTVLSSLTYQNDIEFLTNRANISDRTAIWNRGSALKAPLPYKSTNRQSVQIFRQDGALMDRAEHATAYVNSAASISSISNYKYIDTKSSQTINYAWSNPTSILNLSHIRPEIEERIQCATAAIPTANGYLGQDAHSGTPTFKTVVTNQSILYPTPNISTTYNINYTPHYDYAFSFVSRDKYYVSDTSDYLKPSLYAANIPISTCPYNKSKISDIYNESFVLLSSEVFHNIDSFIVSDIKQENYYFKLTNLFVVWTAVNSGEFVFTGFYPSVAEEHVFPSISLFHNGLSIPYGEKWKLSSDNNAKVVLISPETWVNLNDILYLHYDTLGGERVANNINATATRRYHEQTLIQYTNHDYLQELTFKNNPVVTWRKEQTGEIINISRMTDEVFPLATVNRVSQIPAPAEFFDIAVPDVIIKYNGVELIYNQDWRFKYYPLATPAVRIELLSTISSYLNIGDIFYLDYTGDGVTVITSATGFGGSEYGSVYGE